jgi:predicted permease
MSIWARIKDFGPWLRARKERDLEREIRDHLDLEAEESGEDGARRTFGNAMLVREDVRAAWGWTRLEQFSQDIRGALRQMRRSPSFSMIVVGTLALGIGANTAMFSVVDAVLIRPLPYADSDRLVMVWEDASRIGFARGTPASGTWNEWRRLNDVFADVAATRASAATLSGDGEPEQVPGRRVTANLWTVLGSQPLLGRAFNEDEDRRRAPVAVISYGLWQRRFGGSRDVIGRKITVNDSPYEVIGVMSREFYFLPTRDVDIWMPAAFTSKDLSDFGGHNLTCVARLKPGVTIRRAGESMAVLSQRIAEQHGDGARKAWLIPMREELAGKTKTSLLVLLCASASILLISCVNVANLLLSRGAARRREVAMRSALGASRRRLVLQLLIESLVLAGFGAVAGLALASPAMRFLQTLVPQTMVAMQLTLDWRVLAFSATAAMIAGLAVGLAPALGGSCVALQETLKEGERGSTGARSQLFQHSLVVIETALAVVLLAGGGLLLETLQHLRHIDLGIRTDKLLTMVTPFSRYRTFDKRVGFVNSMLEAVRAVPGVISVGAISDIPLTADGGSAGYQFAGQPLQQARGQDALFRVVTRGYFSTVGARLLEGRFFDSSDRATKEPVAIVNESFAERNFSGRSALGARFQYSNIYPEAYWYTIVGVVKEIRERGVAVNTKPAVYLVHEQADQAWPMPSGLVVRTAVDPASIVPAVRQAIWSVDKNEPIARIQTLDDIVTRELSEPSQDSTLLGAFAALALTLACLGLYGVLSYAVTQRTNEIGVRMALGATSGDILLFFSRRGLALTGAGLGLGLGLAMAATRLMTALLYGFQPNYAPAVAAVSGILVVVAAAACFVPARRAARIDPIVALRHE